MKYNLQKLSKTTSYALRHAPWEYELELDNEGWTNVDDLISALHQENVEWKNLTKTALEEMINKSDKKRLEIVDNKIRALYGHSIPYKLHKIQASPPSILYHGTPLKTSELIMIEGLKPMSRQYVHLSTDVETAYQVGKRKSKDPVILLVNAKEASKNGICFYIGNEHVWLSDCIKPEFISILK